MVGDECEALMQGQASWAPQGMAHQPLHLRQFTSHFQGTAGDLCEHQGGPNPSAVTVCPWQWEAGAGDPSETEAGGDN